MLKALPRKILIAAHKTALWANKLKLPFYNSSWICPHINEHDEENSGDVSGGGTSGGNTRFYRFITLPTTYKFYIITAIELGDGGGPNAGSAIAGVDVVNADPPTNNSSVLVALATLFSLSAGSGPSIKNTNVISKPIRGGSILGAWVNTSADNTVTLTSTLGTYFKIMAYDTSPEFANNTTFIYNALTGVPAIKIYYRGYD